MTVIPIAITAVMFFKFSFNLRCCMIAFHCLQSICRRQMYRFSWVSPLGAMKALQYSLKHYLSNLAHWTGCVYGCVILNIGELLWPSLNLPFLIIRIAHLLINIGLPARKPWKQKKVWHFCQTFLGGSYRVRTCDPLLVRQMLWTSWAKLPFSLNSLLIGVANIDTLAKTAIKNIFFW